MSPKSVSERLRLERLGGLHATCLRLAGRQEREHYTQLVACRCDDQALLRIIRGFVFEPGKEPCDYPDDERDRRARLNLAVWSAASCFPGVPLHNRLQDRLRDQGGPMKAILVPQMQLVIHGEQWFGVVVGDSRSFERVAADAAELSTPRQTDPAEFFPWLHTYAQRNWIETLFRVVGMSCNRFRLSHEDTAVLSSTGLLTFDVAWLPCDLFTASAKAIETLMESARTENRTTDKRSAKVLSENRGVAEMKREAYFVLIELVGPGHDDICVVGRFESLTSQEAELLERSLWQFAKADFGYTGPAIWCESETNVLKDDAKHLRWCAEAHRIENRLSTCGDDSKDALLRLARAARDYVEALRSRENGTTNSAPTRLEAFDVEAGECVVFDRGDSQHWGPVEEPEGGSPFDPPDFVHATTLYRHQTGHWTLLTQRTFCETGECGPPEAHRLSDADAADWLLRHGHELPEDVAHLAENSLFRPGAPNPSPAVPESLDDPAKRRSNGQRRLTVAIDPPQAVLDGTPYALTQDGATFVQALLNAEGDWVAGCKLDMRADRVKKALPKPIRELIESSPGKGYRIPRKVLA